MNAPAQSASRVCWIATGIFCLVLAGCGGPAGGPGAVQSGGAAPPVPVLDMPSREASAELAARIEDAVARGDVAALGACFDWDLFLDRVTRGLEDAQGVCSGFRRGFKGSVDSAGSFASVLCNHPLGKVTYRLVRIHDEREQRYALFRMQLADGSLNYHDFLLTRKPDGQAIAADIYIFVAGEPLSESVRRMFLPLVREASKSFLARLTEKENDFVAHVDEFRKMTEMTRTGQYDAVLKTYQSLPVSMQQDKSILIIRLSAAAQVNEEEYMRAIADFRRHFPSDPALDLMLIDWFVLKRDFAKARERIDRLDQAVGGDPLLNVIRANTFLEENRYDEATRYARKVAEIDDLKEQATWVLVAVSLAQGHFAETSRLLDALVRDCGVEIGDLTTIPEYAEYVKSAEYKDWLSRRPRP